LDAHNESLLLPIRSNYTLVGTMPLAKSSLTYSYAFPTDQVRASDVRYVLWRDDFDTSNSSSSPLSLVSPKEFDYHISIYRAQTPIDETAAYMNLLAAMNELAFMPKQLSLDAGRMWSLPTYHLCVMVKSKEIRFAVWGLLYVFEALYNRRPKLRPMTIDMAWEGNYVGEVHVTTDCLRSGMLVSNGSVGMGNTLLNTTAAIGGGRREVQYILTPNGGPVTIGDIFHVAMSTLADSAERGVEVPFVSIEDDVLGFQFAAALDRSGVSMMTVADLMRTVVYVAKKMVADRSFTEVGIQVLKNGRRIGEGQLRNPRKVASL